MGLVAFRVGDSLLTLSWERTLEPSDTKSMGISVVMTEIASLLYKVCALVLRSSCVSVLFGILTVSVTTVSGFSFDSDSLVQYALSCKTTQESLISITCRLIDFFILGFYLSFSHHFSFYLCVSHRFSFHLWPSHHEVCFYSSRGFIFCGFTRNGDFQMTKFIGVGTLLWH